jgi:hypothetical protein
MRAVELVAWGEALGVTMKEVPWALRARARRLEDIHNELVRERALLSDAPDEELVVQLMSAARVIAAAACHLEDAVSDAQRDVG